MLCYIGKNMPMITQEHPAFLFHLIRPEDILELKVCKIMRILKCNHLVT
jgi:hypothetical protein